MDTADRLRKLAERALRLARAIGTPDVAERLKQAAAEYRRQAEQLDGGGKPAQQQQQPQPKPDPADERRPDETPGDRD